MNAKRRMKEKSLIVLLVAVGQANSQTPPIAPRKFEVASIKPSNSTDRRPFFDMTHVLSGGQFSASNVTVKRLIQLAYRIKDFQISGGPGWAGSDLFDIAAKPDGPAKPEEFQSMLQSLLAERFALLVRRETREMPVYALVIGKNGPKLKESVAGSGPRMTKIRRGLIAAEGTTMAALSGNLSTLLSRTVADKTGLTGQYDLRIEWTPDENQTAMLAAEGVPETTNDTPPPDAFGPSLVTALQEQLGLSLESQRGAIKLLVLERIQRPTPN